MIEIKNKLQPNDEMSASLAFNGIIQQVKMSNLNYHLQESPFSAIISLKKSFITNKYGQVIFQSSTDPSTNYYKENVAYEELQLKIKQLESDLALVTEKLQNKSQGFPELK